MKLVIGIVLSLVGLWVIVVVVGLLVRLVLVVTKPGWNTFVDRWDEAQGFGSWRHLTDHRYVRGASDISDEELMLMRAVYKQWRKVGRPPLREWLQEVMKGLEP
jgi:hypothetical protein